MKSNELRIGNWGSHDGNQYIVNGIDIGRARIARLTETGSETEWIDTEYLKPIPLTEEWLVKFGFVRQGKRNMWVKDKLCVEFKELPNLRGDFIEGWYIGLKDLGNVLFHSFMKIEHVHQLQNLYHALTGQELTIKEQ